MATKLGDMSVDHLLRGAPGAGLLGEAHDDGVDGSVGGPIVVAPDFAERGANADRHRTSQLLGGGPDAHAQGSALEGGLLRLDETSHEPLPDGFQCKWFPHARHLPVEDIAPCVG